MGALTGRALTVLGPLDPARLGVTLMHEHLLADLGYPHWLPTEAGAKGQALRPLSLASLSYASRHWDNLDDNRLLDEEEAIAEALLYKRAGGETIVDVTTIGIGRDPPGLARISRATGLNVVMGAGYYSMEVPQPGLEAKSEGQIADEIEHDIAEGFGWPAARAGIIGEIASSWPRHPNEEKVLRAAAVAQVRTGAPLLIHPGRDARAVFEILVVIEQAGGDVTRTVMGHLERTIFDDETLERLAATGCYLEFDLFGHESSYYPINPSISMPNDARRIDALRRLIERGYLDRILVAQDICNKRRWRRYGGHGYGHLIENVAPMMLRKGMTAQDLETVFIANPRRVLTFA